MKLIMTSSWPGSTRRNQWFSGWLHTGQQQSMTDRNVIYSTNRSDPWSFCWSRIRLESEKRP